MENNSERKSSRINEPIILHNLLNAKYLDDLRKPLDASWLSWYYQPRLNWGETPGAQTDHFGFSHIFFEQNEIKSAFYPVIAPLIPTVVSILKLQLLQVVRIKINLTIGISVTQATPHIDTPASEGSSCFLACVYYPFDATGNLCIWNRHPTKKSSLDLQATRLGEPTWTIEPRANSCVVFDATLFHTAMLPKSGETRLAINNLIEVAPNVVS